MVSIAHKLRLKHYGITKPPKTLEEAKVLLPQLAISIDENFDDFIDVSFTRTPQAVHQHVCKSQHYLQLMTNMPTSAIDVKN